jgi:hypothetical protein
LMSCQQAKTNEQMGLPPSHRLFDTKTQMDTLFCVFKTLTGFIF